MGDHQILLCFFPLLASLVLRIFAIESSSSPTGIDPFNCSPQINSCNASLYYANKGLQQQQVASFYSISPTQINPFPRAGRQDYLVSVPCSCKTINGTTAYFYDVPYKVKPGDTFFNVNVQIYGGQAWPAGDEANSFVAGEVVFLHILCGCFQSDSKVLISYTVEDKDTLSDIAVLLSSSVSEIQSINAVLAPNPGFINVGWVLYVPTDRQNIVAPGGNNPAPVAKGASRKRRHWPIIIGIMATVTLILMFTVIIILIRRSRSAGGDQQSTKSASKATPKATSKATPKAVSNILTRTTSSLKDLYKENMGDGAFFESERPITFSLQEVEDATCNFDKSKKIGEGGYGDVYFGVLAGQEVAIKKMRSSKSKEFFAELKVLCKIHHINVVELLGYASSDEHFYLVYEFVRNGSLSDHLHDPLLKGLQPLSWTARTRIALDAAKGIEYIHDHTKARYVHRDIKSSNILLDERLRAKVADFGMAKLVERSNYEEDLIATRLVGTPGYLAPEAVKELQVTSKMDVFAFGVVLAELITGQRALIRDNREPTKMKSLITIIQNVFEREDPENALEKIIDGNLQGCYHLTNVFKMAEIADWCLSEDPNNRPHVRDVVTPLSHIVNSSMEYEASLGESSKVFSGILNGR